MEKIKRAIEESKRQQTECVGQAQVASEPVDTPVSSEAEASHDMTCITYEQTRVVKLNPEHLAKNRIVAINKNDHLSLGFDILRTQVIEKMKKKGWHTIAVTSPTPGCGKSVISINLAMSIAHHTDKTAMLIDFDLRRPSVARYLGLSSGPSMNDVLSGDATIAQALVNPGLDRLVILPTAMPVKHSSEVLSSQKVSNIIKDVSERYPERIVMFDTTPLLGSDDAMNLMSQVDCVLVVVGNGMVSKSELMESMRYVDNKKLLGTVLNKSESPQASKWYYDY